VDGTVGIDAFGVIALVVALVAVDDLAVADAFVAIDALGTLDALGTGKVPNGHSDPNGQSAMAIDCHSSSSGWSSSTVTDLSAIYFITKNENAKSKDKDINKRVQSPNKNEESFMHNIVAIHSRESLFQPF
jgi:hypothetical protein